jgi:outer membrane protein TolC
MFFGGGWILFFILGMLGSTIAGDTGRSDTVIFLSINEAITMALKQNRALIVTANSLESSRLGLENAQSSFDIKYAPSVISRINSGTSSSGAGIVFKRKLTYGPEISLTPYLRHTDGNNNLRVSLGLTVPLMGRFGKDINMSSVYSAEFSLRNARRSEYLSKVNTVLMTVAYAYRMEELKKLVDLYQSRKEKLNEYAIGTTLKKEAGLAAPMDEFRTQILIKDVEDKFFQARDSLSNLEEAFKKLLALNAEDRLDVLLPEALPSSEIALDEAISKALKNRVEIQQAQDTLSEKIRQMKLAEKNMLPNLNLVLNYHRYGISDAFDDAFVLDQDYYSAQLTSSTDWGRKTEKIAYQKSKIAVQNAKIDLSLANDTIIADVKQAFRANQKNLERIEIRKAQLDKAFQKLKLSTIKYQYEMADNFDVIESEKEIQQAQADLWAVKDEYAVGVYQFRAAMGTLIEKE